MTTYYSAATGGFYRDDIHDPARIPQDAVELPGGDVERQMLLDGMSQNKRIVADDSGYPILIDNPPVSDKELAEMVRQERDNKLRESDWSQLPDVPPVLRKAWVPYRQALRDIPAQSGFPHQVEWPAFPTEN